MSSNAVGFLFALAVLIRYELAPRLIAWYRERAAAIAECARVGHRFGEPFEAMGALTRTCTRCNRQEHRNSVGEWR